MADPDGSEAASAAKPHPHPHPHPNPHPHPKPPPPPPPQPPRPVRPSEPRKLAATPIRSKKIGAATSNGDDRNDQ